MAEYIFRDMVDKSGYGDRFVIESRATSFEEEGNGIHYGTSRVLDSLGIDAGKKRAHRLEREDKDRFDYFIGMDRRNVRDIDAILGEKRGVKLLDFTPNPRDIADPWYTGNFEKTYSDIKEGLEAFLLYLEENVL